MMTASLHARTLFLRGFAFALTALLLACDNTGGEQTATTPVADAQAPLVDTQLSGQAASVWFTEEMNELLDYPDRDLDGIRDSQDAWPDESPELRAATAAEPLEIVRVWTDIGANQLRDTAVEGEPLFVEVDGLPAAGSGSLWIVLMTASGARAIAAEMVESGVLTIVLPSQAQSIHVVSGNSRGASYTIEAVGRHGPLILAQAGALPSGGETILRGRNLLNVTSVRLGSQELTVLELHDESISIQLPTVAATEKLQVFTENEGSNTIALNLRRDVRVQVDPDLPLAHDEQLSFKVLGADYLISHGSAATVSLPVWRPAVLTFNVVGPEGVRSYQRVATVIWPKVNEVTVSETTSLLARLASMRQFLSAATGTDWEVVQANLEQALQTQEAIDFIAALRESLLKKKGFPREQMLFEVTQAYEQLMAPDLAGSSVLQANASAIYTNAPKALDDYIGSTVTYRGEGLPADAANGAEYFFPREVIGDEYAQVSIVGHDDNRFSLTTFNPFRIFDPFQTCDYADSEAAWPVGKGIWPSDLCIQIDGPIYVSVAVIDTGARDSLSAKTLLDQIASGQKFPELKRRHIQHQTLDNSRMLGTGGYYLKSDDNKPLCKMGTCFVELLSSGYGAYHLVSLTPAQEKLVETMRLRMWLDVLLNTMLKVMGLGLDTIEPQAFDAISQCFSKEIIKSVAAQGAMASLRADLKAKNLVIGLVSEDTIVEEAIAYFDKNIGDWAVKELKQQVSNGLFSKCLLEDTLLKQVEDNVKAQFSPVNLAEDSLPPTKIAQGLFTFTEILAFVEKLGAVILTPEKFVFRMDPRVRISNIGPATIDLMNSAKENLFIEGNWLAGQNNPEFYPELLFRDKYGKEKIIQINSSQVAFNGVRASIEVPYVIYEPFLKDLSAGPLHMELAYTDPESDGDYEAYPKGKLRAPMPSNAQITLQTQTKIFGFKPPIVEPGAALTIVGTRLSIYGETPNLLLVHPTNSAVRIPLELLGTTNDPDAEIRVRIPLYQDKEKTVPLVSANYTVQLAKNLNDEKTAYLPLPVVLSDDTIFVTEQQDLNFIAVGDLGEFKDDAIMVEIMDSSNTALIDGYGNFGRFYVPENSRDEDDYKPDDEGSGFVNGRSWEFQTALDAAIDRVRVYCQDPGYDKTCSYGIRLNSALRGLCYDENKLEPVDRMHGSLKKGEADYYLLEKFTPTGPRSCEYAAFETLPNN